jgi:hypothetical protein
MCWTGRLLLCCARWHPDRMSLHTTWVPPLDHHLASSGALSITVTSQGSCGWWMQQPYWSPLAEGQDSYR